MKKQSYHIIGVMSGTSLDGIDLCYAQFNYTNNWSFNILKASTTPYSDFWRDTLNASINLNKDLVQELNTSYTYLLAEVINDFMASEDISVLDAVCSHGHTVFHQPEKGYTLQIGNLSVLASIIKSTIVCDFRIQDVKLGGQGAPLVPIGDKLLFNSYDVCVNLGGFANLSYDKEESRIAFDICPANIVLNYYMRQMGFEYDNKGSVAASGIIHLNLLNRLNSLSFYELKEPKSLGLEFVKNEIYPLIDSFKLAVKDVLRTLVEHIAIQISLQLNRTGGKLVLFTGGGVFNSFLMSRISELIESEVFIPSNEIIEYKEALIFGFLGVLKLRNEVNCLSSVTGAKKDHSSGKIFIP